MEHYYYHLNSTGTNKELQKNVNLRANQHRLQSKGESMTKGRKTIKTLTKRPAEDDFTTK